MAATKQPNSRLQSDVTTAASTSYMQPKRPPCCDGAANKTAMDQFYCGRERGKVIVKLIITTTGRQERKVMTPKEREITCL